MKSRVTMKDIAQKLHVSINAVSIALNDKVGVSTETRNCILNEAEALGYFRIKNKYKKALMKKNICLIIQERYFLKSDFYSKIVLGIENEAKKYGYELLINFPNEQKHIPDCLNERRACGVISVGRISDKCLYELKQYKVPIVIVDHTSLSVPTDCIISNNKQGTYEITRLMIKNGYKKIGFFGDLDYSMSIKDRFAGYKEAIHTLPFIQDYVDTARYALNFSAFKDIEENIIHHDVDKIIMIVKKIHEIPEAFVCSNDNAAVILIRALQKIGYRVPNDIGVVGFDNTTLSTASFPHLTTVNVYKEAMGKTAVDRLIWRLDHLNEPIKSTVLNVKIVIRDSINGCVKRSSQFQGSGI